MRETVIQKCVPQGEKSYAVIMKMLNELGHKEMEQLVAKDALTEYTEQILSLISKTATEDIAILMVAMRSVMEALELEPRFKQAADSFCPSFGIKTASMIIKKENKL